MEILLNILSFALGLLSSYVLKYIPNRRKMDEYVKEALKHMKVIIETDLPSEKTSYAHEIVKKLYDNVSKDIGAIAASNDVAKVRQALSAARIYYWVRLCTENVDEEIVQLIEERQRHIQRQEARSHSCEYVIQELKKFDHSKPKLAEGEIRLLKDNCLADIAELEKLSLSVTISRRFKL